jgi:hypothetical protein
MTNRDKVNKAAREDFYNYSLHTDKNAMQKYINICREQKTTAAQEISDFVRKKVEKYEEQAAKFYAQKLTEQGAETK